MSPNLNIHLIAFLVNQIHSFFHASGHHLHLVISSKLVLHLGHHDPLKDTGVWGPEFELYLAPLARLQLNFVLPNFQLVVLFLFEKFDFSRLFALIEQMDVGGLFVVGVAKLEIDVGVDFDIARGG